MINPAQLETKIIVPELKRLDKFIPFSQEAVDLLMMTGAHESKMGYYVAQVGGPAKGLFQVEDDTLFDLDVNYLSYRRDLMNMVIQGGEFTPHRMTGDLLFQTRVARVQYYRRPGALPRRRDFGNHDAYLYALAEYAKWEWNTEYGAATVEDYFNAYKAYVMGDSRY